MFLCVCVCALHSEPPFHSDCADTLIIQSYRRWCKTDEGTQGCVVYLFSITFKRLERRTGHSTKPPPLVITSNRKHAIIAVVVSEGWHQGHFSAKKLDLFSFRQTCYPATFGWVLPSIHDFSNTQLYCVLFVFHSADNTAGRICTRWRCSCALRACLWA